MVMISQIAFRETRGVVKSFDFDKMVFNGEDETSKKGMRSAPERRISDNEKKAEAE